MTTATALAGWQAEVGSRLLLGEHPEPLARDRDTPAGRAGWPLTVALYQQWRFYRIRSLAPLTLVRLGNRAGLVVDAYLAANPGSSSYAGTDAAAFLAFAASALPEDRYLDEITFLELALIRARRPAGTDHRPQPGYFGRSRRASLRTVPYPAADLMLWLAGRADRPQETLGPALVAPGVPGLVRAATTGETAVWHWLAMDRPRRLAPHGWAEPTSTLRAAGALAG
jgi:hypothetical protein